MSAVAVDASSFAREVLEHDGPVLVDFWATWCGPCKQVAPVLDEIAAERAGQVKVVKVDIDANPELARTYRVMSVPTLAVFDSGQIVRTVIGAKSKGALLAEVDKAL